MRLYCHRCGKVQPFADSSNNTISCQKCGHQQPITIKGMATKKNPLTDPDGSKQTKRTASRGGLTNSKRFQTPDISSEEPIQSVLTGNEGSSGTLSNANKNDSVSTRTSFGQSHTEALSKANSIASQYGLQEIDLSSLLGSDPYTADGNIPQMSASDANQQKLILQRQSNSIEVRHEKLRLGRKVVKMATEQIGLIGDLVDHSTASIDTATKVIKNEIAEIKFLTEDSKLAQTQEFLVQQQIATDGTIALTTGIREEWNLKLEKQFTRNSGLRIEVEGSIQENERKRQELESKLLSA